MSNKKRIAALALSATMVAGMLAGCGGSASESAPADTSSADASTEEAAPAEEATEEAAPAGDEGSVLNIQVWNDEFKSRVENYYPGYETTSEATVGKIGDVTVNWTITPSDDLAYQNNLDKLLLAQESASADDKVDLFLVEADYALKYVDTDYAMTLKDLGISDSDLSDQYEYTKTIVTDSNGNLKGSSWQACSAGLIYNREIAKEVLGTDDPDEVQEAVKDWDTYTDTAKKVQAAGYKMCSVNDTYRVYSNNVSGKWVQDNKIVIDDNLMNWINDSKELVDAKAESTDELWGDDWAKAKNGGVFCFFGPAWFFNFCLDADREGSVAHDGGWGFCEGPQSYYWGGTWMCAATGTDNPTLVKDIITTMSTDKDVLKAIAIGESECVNSKSVLADLASSDEGNIALLGGQNPYADLAAGAEGIDLSNLSAYDQGCNEELQTAMKSYFEGKASLDDALDQFYTSVGEKYPELDTTH